MLVPRLGRELFADDYDRRVQLQGISNISRRFCNVKKKRSSYQVTSVGIIM
jgi:hypothetical protein